MVITITMKNVIKQGNIYHFRVNVPKDCREAVEKREIVQSLKTKDPVDAAQQAKILTAKWKQRFKDIRSGGTGHHRSPGGLIPLDDPLGYSIA